MNTDNATDFLSNISSGISWFHLIYLKIKLIVFFPQFCSFLYLIKCRLS